MNTRTPDDPTPRKYVAAFADGELDVEQNLELLEHMAMDPETTRRVMHQQQLRQAVDRAMSAEPGPAPAALRDRITALAQDPDAGGTGPEAASPPGILGRIGRGMMPFGLAAALVLAVLLGIQLSESTDPGARPQEVAGPTGGIARVLPASEFTEFSRRHVVCSRKLTRLDDSIRFPDQLTALPGPLGDYLGLDAPAPDLSALGYRFAGAGPCPVPGDRAAHLLYRADEKSGRQDAISLWLKPWTGEPTIEAGRVHTVAGEDAAHPMLVWRRNGLVYYLVGDGMERVNEARDQIFQSAFRPRS